MSDYKTVKDFGANTERLIGYFYAGLSAILIISLLEPLKIKAFIDTLGTPISIIMALALGIGIYSIYFHVIGEFFLFQVQRLFHFFIDRILGHTKQKQRSTTGYLGYLGVPFVSRRRAYECLKNEFFSDEIRTEIHLKHGELHILYITATYCIAALLYSVAQHKPYMIWLYAGIFFLIGALIVDISQHSKESQIFKQRTEAELKEFLKNKGFEMRN